MSENSLLTILHISDFHYSKRRQREQGFVVEALIADLKTLCIGHRKPDLIMFTGDLVHAAGIDLHDEAYDFLIDRVSKATGCSDERIFIGPGNHDLSWLGVERFGSALRDWRSIIGSETETARLNELHEAKTFDKAVEDKFSKYLELEQYFNSGDRSAGRRLKNAFVTVDHVAALNVDIVVFNTAVFSTGGHKAFEEDERKLAVPEYAVMEAISVLTPKSLRIFVTHHPLVWLSQQSSRLLESEVTKHAQIHLFGHMHDPQPKRIVGLRGEVVTNQAGAIFTSRSNYYNGYALLTIDRSNSYVETLIRSYFKDRIEFDDGIDVIEAGRWWSSNDARQHFRQIASPVDDVRFRAHLCGDALRALREREGLLGGEGNLHLRFVAPPLARTFIQEVKGEEENVEAETTIPFSDVTAGDANLILYAKAEYGRTTLLRELRLRLLADAETLRFPRLPAMVDFGDLSSNVDNMLRKVKAGTELPPDNNDVESSRIPSFD